MTQVHISMDEQLKHQADSLFQKMGLNFSAGINILVTQAVAEGRLSLSPEKQQELEDQALLTQSIQEQSEGNVIRKTLEELRAMES